MSKLENIFKEWNKNSEKTELASEKVELNYIKEINKAKTEIKKKVEKAIDRARKVEKEYQAVNADNKKLESELEAERKRVFALLQDAYNMAADLGVDLPSDFNKGYDELTDDLAKLPVSNLANIFPI